MNDAFLIFSRASWQILSGFENIRSFREITEYGLPFVERAMQIDGQTTANFVMNNAEFNDIFKDKEGLLAAVGGVKGMADRLSLQRVSTYKDMAMSMNLIFAHSLLDGVVSDFIISIAIKSPEAFDPFIELKKVSMQVIKTKSYEEIRHDLVHDYISDLNQKSMIERIDKIFALCSPDSSFRPIIGYEYDRDRLKKLDKLRHEIIHDNIRIKDLPNGTNDLYFMRQTGLFLMAIIHERFGLAIVTSLIFPGTS